MTPNIGLTDDARQSVVDLLNAVLADEYVLYTKTRNYHWNVVGPTFSELHKFFEAQYEELDDVVDDVAERVRAIGGRALGSLAEFIKHARLTESPDGSASAREMIADLLGGHEALIRTLREDLDVAVTRNGDAGTSDFLTGLMEKHEKMAWMLRAFLGTPA